MTPRRAGTNRAARRALVIGLDGLPLTLARQFAGSGVMPGLRELLAHGRTAELVAPVPEVSSTSWATFLTGVNPARHGIYGFTDVRPGGYEVYFPNLTDLRAPALWDYAAAEGLTTLSLNVPGTYPAPLIRGAVVSGFVAPLAQRAVQPPRLADALRRFDYQIEAEVGDVAADPAAFIARLRRALAARVALFTHLLRTEPWDLAIAVVTETDRLQHFLWGQLSDPRAPLNGLIADFYTEVDQAVTDLAGCCAGEAVDTFIISDHGFGPARCQFQVNAWLRTLGWLAPIEVSPSLSALDTSTRAFALDPGRFYLHRKDRFERGAVTPAQAGELAAELAAALRELRWRDGAIGPDVDGPALISEVYLADEIYHGPLIEQAPDVVAVPAAGVQLRGAWRSSGLVVPDQFTGAHTRGDALFWTSASDIRTRAPERALGSSSPVGTVGTVGTVDMADVAPAVLRCLGADQGRLLDLDGQDLRAPAIVPGRIN